MWTLYIISIITHVYLAWKENWNPQYINTRRDDLTWLGIIMVIQVVVGGIFIIMYLP